MITVDVPKIIQLPKILDTRGNLSFFESEKQLPFEIARTYWIYDVPGGAKRGGHAFKSQMEFIVVLSGSVDVILNDGVNETLFALNRSYYGLYVPKMYWREIRNFSTNSFVMIVSDKGYNDEDYIRNFEEFKILKNV